MTEVLQQAKEAGVPHSPTDRTKTQPTRQWDGRLAVQGWLASRLILAVIALSLILAGHLSPAQPFSQWDAAHFIAVADHGYTSLTQTAYFPGLPLLMALFHLVGIPPVATGVAGSLVGSGLAAWAVYRLAGGSTQGTIAVLAWSFAPMTVFTFVPYTEAIFCAFAFWAFWYAKQDNWTWAGILAAGACAFRVSGLFLVGALGIIALWGRNSTPPRFMAARSGQAGLVGPGPTDSGPGNPGPAWRQRLRRVAWLGLPTAVLVAYVIYLRISFGSWTTWFHAQGEGWGREFAWPWQAVDTTLRVAGVIGEGGWQSTSVIFCWEVAAAVVGLGVAIWCFATRKVPEGSWVGIQVLALSCQMWVISLARSIVLWFPLFTLAGRSGTTRLGGATGVLRWVVVAAGLVCEATWMVWWALRFFTGAWAG